jgi:hypothetical protein
MRRVIDGKIYNTATAYKVCDISPSGFSRGDFRYEDTYLYKSPKGTFFVAGEGGPMTRWAVPEGQGGRRSGSGIQIVSEDEAKSLVEQHGSDEDYEEAFGQPEEG